MDVARQAHYSQLVQCCWKAERVVQLAPVVCRCKGSDNLHALTTLPPSVAQGNMNLFFANLLPITLSAIVSVAEEMQNRRDAELPEAKRSDVRGIFPRSKVVATSA